jgi:hypothetical protein
MRRLRVTVSQLGLSAWLAVTAVSEVAAQGCAMCRTALGGADDPLTRGFFWSVLCLMGAPYVVAAVIGGWLAYRHVVATRADAEGAGSPLMGDETGGGDAA